MTCGWASGIDDINGTGYPRRPHHVGLCTCKVSNSLDTTSTAPMGITITSSIKLTTGATVVIAHVHAISTSLSSLTSPISSLTNMAIRTTDLNGPIESSNATVPGAFATILQGQCRRAALSEKHRPLTTHHTTGTNAGAATLCTPSTG